MKLMDKIKGLSKGVKIAIVSLIVILIAARVAAPCVIVKYVNKTLCGDIAGYCGKIEDVDLCLIRGAYVIEGIALKQVENDIQTPFVAIDEVDISIQWKALLQGAIVAEIEFIKPVINVVKTKGEEVQAGQGADWRQVVKDLVPLSINRLAVIDGKVSYKEPDADPKVDIYLDNIDVIVTNLNNSANEEGKLVSDLELSAFALNHAFISADGAIDPFNKNGSFDINLQLSELEIKTFNDYIKKAINVDVQEGTFDLYTEMKAKDGQLSGYAKPLIKNLNFLELPEEKENNFFNKIWEGVLDITVNVLQNNKEEEQVASNIVINGSLQKPAVEIFTSIRYLFRNAFIEGLKPKLYNIVDFGKDNDLTEDIAEEEIGKDKKKKAFKNLFKKKDK